MANVYLVPTGTKVKKPRSVGTPAAVPVKEQGTQSTFGSTLEDRIYIGLLRLGWKEDQISAQYSVLGGRKWKGGQVVDFVLYTPMPVAILVQGDYFHADPDRELLREAALVDEFARVIEIWEHDCGNDQQLMATLQREIGRP